MRLLAAHDVDYLLVGGWAVGYHGYPRATADLDVWVRRTATNAERLVAALADFGFGVTDLDPELFLDEARLVRMGVAPLRIEILTSISGVEFDECYDARITAEIDGVDVDVLDLAHLKANKLASGRHKDLDDLENL